MGCNSGFLLGSAAAALASTIIGDEAMQTWGWRIPFFLGALIALYALLLRRSLAESPPGDDDGVSRQLVVVLALWYALHEQSLLWVVFAQLAFAAINGTGWALTVPVMVENVPAKVRCGPRVSGRLA